MSLDPFWYPWVLGVLLGAGIAITMRLLFLGNPEASMRPQDFPDPPVGRPSPAEAMKLLALVRKHAVEWADYFIQTYLQRVEKCHMWARTLRVVAFGAIVLGSTIFMGRLLSPEVQKTVMVWISGNETTSQSLPAELGLVLFALAAGLFVADKFSSLSENWVRYRIAAMSLRRNLFEFQVRWQLSSFETEADITRATTEIVDSGAGTSKVVPLRSNDDQQVKSASDQEALKSAADQLTAKPELTNAEVVARVELLNSFITGLFNLVEQETQEWAKAFRKNQSQLENYLKVQSASTSRPTGAASRRSASASASSSAPAA